MSGRFVVQTVTGYPINPRGLMARPNRPPSTAYAVLDSAVCYRIVKEFPAHRRSEDLANQLCARLNEWDDLDGEGPVPE